MRDPLKLYKVDLGAEPPTVETVLIGTWQECLEYLRAQYDHPTSHQLAAGHCAHVGDVRYVFKTLNSSSEFVD